MRNDRRLAGSRWEWISIHGNRTRRERVQCTVTGVGRGQCTVNLFAFAGLAVRPSEKPGAEVEPGADIKDRDKGKRTSHR